MITAQGALATNLPLQVIADLEVDLEELRNQSSNQITDWQSAAPKRRLVWPVSLTVGVLLAAAVAWALWPKSNPPLPPVTVMPLTALSSNSTRSTAASMSRVVDYPTHDVAISGALCGPRCADSKDETHRSAQGSFTSFWLFSQGRIRSSGAAFTCPRSTRSGTYTSPSRTRWAGWTTTLTSSVCSTRRNSRSFR